MFHFQIKTLDKAVFFVSGTSVEEDTYIRTFATAKPQEHGNNTRRIIHTSC